MKAVELRLGRQKQGYLFVLPCLVMLLLILGFPAFMAVLNSFTPIWSKGISFTLANYQRLAKDPVFWNALGRTFLFVGSTVILHFVLGLATPERRDIRRFVARRLRQGRHVQLLLSRARPPAAHDEDNDRDQDQQRQTDCADTEDRQ